MGVCCDISKWMQFKKANYYKKMKKYFKQLLKFLVWVN